MHKNTEAVEEHDMFEEQEEAHYVWDVESVWSKAGDGMF